jgi:hypothetical protein
MHPAVTLMPFSMSAAPPSPALAPHLCSQWARRGAAPWTRSAQPHGRPSSRTLGSCTMHAQLSGAVTLWWWQRQCLLNEASKGPLMGAAAFQAHHSAMPRSALDEQAGKSRSPPRFSCLDALLPLSSSPPTQYPIQTPLQRCSAAQPWPPWYSTQHAHRCQQALIIH